MSSKPLCCPYCGKTHLAEASGVFVEMGECLPSGDYEAEGFADGWRCGDCGGEFWTNGPAMPQRGEADKDA